LRALMVLNSLQETIKCYKMMIRSGRKFDDIKLSLWDYNDRNVEMLNEIFDAQCEHVRKITISFGNISRLVLSHLLTSLYNLEDITLDVNLLEDSKQNSFSSHESLKNLVKLRKLSCNVHGAEIVFELLKNILTELNFTSSIRNDPPSSSLLRRIFLSQKNLKVFNVNGTNLEAGMLENLSLDELRLVSCQNFSEVLKSQEKCLKKLSIVHREPISLDDIDQICKMEVLESIEIVVRAIDGVDLAHFDKLKKFKKFKVHRDIGTAKNMELIH
jgi:hypothetical protein